MAYSLTSNWSREASSPHALRCRLPQIGSGSHVGPRPAVHKRSRPWTPKSRRTLLVANSDAAASKDGSGGEQGAAACSGATDATVSEQSLVAELVRFAVPALGLVLADPAMSLIDTACVGQACSAVQLAALGPNSAIFNFVFQLFAFLGVTTTSLVARNSLAAPGLTEKELAQRRHAAESTLSHALVLAAACGLVAAAVLRLWGAAALRGMGAGAELMGPALQYLEIRALASPAVMVMSVAQGACLGQQDVWSPLRAFLAAGLINTLGDAYLVCGRGMGVTGAALATAGAQYVSAAALLASLWREGRRPGRVRLAWKGLPRPSELSEFAAVGAALFARTIIGMGAYSAMTVAATRQGVLTAAAHQVAMQVFWFISFVPEPLSLAAQSLIARDRRSPARARRWAWLLLKAGGALALALSGLVWLAFSRGSWLFVSDAGVQAAVQGLVLPGMLAMLICCVMMMMDGISVGSAQLRHLPASALAGLSLTLAALWAGAALGLGLQAVWWALVFFYGARLAAHLAFYAWAGRSSVFAPEVAEPGGLAGAS